MRIYIAGPYTAATTEQVDANIKAARDVMAELLRMGHTPFCPHTMTARMETHHPDIPYEAYIRTGLEWLDVCDSILLLPGWQESRGGLEEVDRARAWGLTFFYSLGEVPEE